MSLTPEETKDAIATGREMAHEREYEHGRLVVGQDRIPPWGALPEEQKANIRRLNHAYWKEMADLGKAIRGYNRS